MWWNQLNQKQVPTTPLPPPRKKAKTVDTATSSKKRKNSLPQKQKQRKVSRISSADSIELLKEDPTHSAYWAEGTGGKGATEAWTFNCLCGEVCSSYENYRYHPVGAMYACTACGVWSHVVCMLGTNFSLDDLKEMEVFILHILFSMNQMFLYFRRCIVKNVFQK